MCEALTKGTAPALVELGAHPSRARGLSYLALLALALAADCCSQSRKEGFHEGRL